MIRAEIRGDDLAGLADEALDTFRPRAEAAVKDCLLLLEGAVKVKLTGSRSGRTYRVSRTGRLHRASAPGEPPAVLFGRLRNSIGHRGPEWSTDTQVAGWVGTNLGAGARMRGGEEDPENYARRLEYGGFDGRGGYIAPRPYMEPAFRETEAAINARLERL
jgi:hypothetical protein